jgi:IgA-specific serine endopeptidase
MTEAQTDTPPWDVSDKDKPMTATEVLQNMADYIGPTSTAIADYNPVAAGLAELKARLKDRAYDLTTVKGNDEARKDRLELVRLRTSVEAKRKELKAPVLERSQLIDSEAARIKAEILALETPIDEQIRADEARREQEKQARVEAKRKADAEIRERIEAVRRLVLRAQGKDSGTIEGKLALAMAFAVDDSFAEFKAEAQSVKVDVVSALQQMHAAALEHEAAARKLAEERAELERQRAELAQREEQERARQAQEQARIAQEQRAEAERLEGIARAQRERLEAEERAAQALREEQDRVAAAARAEQDRIAAEARAAEQARLDEQARVQRQQEEAAAAERAAQAEAAAAEERKQRKLAEDLARVTAELAAAQEAERIAAKTRLEKAAPAMLDALRDALIVLDVHDIAPDVRDRVAAAIRLATEGNGNG